MLSYKNPSLCALHITHPQMSQLQLNAAEGLINANEEWARRIIKDNPNFFRDSATYPQRPKVCPASLFSRVFLLLFRSFGLAALTHEYRLLLSQRPCLATSLHTRTLQSTYLNSASMLYLLSLQSISQL